MSTEYCLYPTLRFNKADWIYLQSLPVGYCCTVIRLSYRMLSLLGLWIDIYICKYIYIDRRRCRVTIWFYNFGEKLLGRDNPTFD